MHQRRSLSYADLLIHAREGAGWLQSLGVKPGDRVVLCTANKLAFLFGHLAAVSAGAVTVPLNPRFAREELRFFLADSGARIAIAGEEAAPFLDSLKPELPALQRLIPDVAVLDSPKSTYRLFSLAAGDPCLILYSSNMTDGPKGTVHTHANVLSSLLALQAAWQLTPDDVVLNVLPLFQAYGLCCATQLTLLTGGCIWLDEFDAPKTIERIGKFSVLMAESAMYCRFLEQSSFRETAQAWQNIRLFTFGSAPMKSEALAELQAILGKPLISCHGTRDAFAFDAATHSSRGSD